MVGTTAGMLLAAGEGRRMGRPKGLVREPDGTPWVARGADLLLTAGCSPVLVVVGAQADDVAALVPPPASPVLAAGWHEGMGASLRTGLGALQSTCPPSCVAVLVSLVDTPDVTPEVLGRLLRVASHEVLARAAYGGVPGHPVLLGRRHWEGVVATAAGDEGARGYLSGHNVQLIECGDVGSGRDVDEPPADLPLTS